MRAANGPGFVADASAGFGPEVFVVPGPAATFPYQLSVRYYDRGPMGYGMGKVQVVHHDGTGIVEIDDRAFVLMDDGAELGLGSVGRPSASPGLAHARHPRPRG